MLILKCSDKFSVAVSSGGQRDRVRVYLWLGNWFASVYTFGRATSGSGPELGQFSGDFLPLLFGLLPAQVVPGHVGHDRAERIILVPRNQLFVQRAFRTNFRPRNEKYHQDGNWRSRRRFRPNLNISMTYKS